MCQSELRKKSKIFQEEIQSHSRRGKNTGGGKILKPCVSPSSGRNPKCSGRYPKYFRQKSKVFRKISKIVQEEIQSISGRNPKYFREKSKIVQEEMQKHRRNVKFVCYPCSRDQVKVKIQEKWKISEIFQGEIQNSSGRNAKTEAKC